MGVIRTSPFIQFFLSRARELLYPSYLTFNCLLSLYCTTFEEDRYPFKVLTRKILLTPVYGVLFILFLPLLLIFLPIRCLLLTVRQPFQYSEEHTIYTAQQYKVIQDRISCGKHVFGISSANLCLMPELVSKMNHITEVDWRAKKIGERIVISQFHNDKWNARELRWKSNSLNGTYDSDVNKHIMKERNGVGNHVMKERSMKSEATGDVTTLFPFLDFLMIQEAWSSYHNKSLICELHKVFPYIIHDVGVHALKTNFFLLNSGLLLASRHPIVAAEFKPFKHFCKHGKIMSKGLLLVKVKLGATSGNKQRVGYIFNTHLQSYQGKDNIIPKQLDEVTQWAKEFIEENTKEGDNTLFSFICGDFNFDNLSPADTESSKHQIFDVYEDICRIRPGIDKPWTVGTELRQDHMFESLVTTREGLKMALDDPALRQCHLVDGDIQEQTKEALVAGHIKRDEHNNVKLFTEGGRRRIDYIIYHKSHPVNVEGFHFVTQLASLTDHIPVAMEFTVK